jgi:hypothetical protein
MIALSGDLVLEEPMELSQNGRGDDTVHLKVPALLHYSVFRKWHSNMKQVVICRRPECDATTQIMLLDSLNVVKVAWLKQCWNQHSAAPNHTAETCTIVFVPHIIWNRESVVDIVTALRDGGPFRLAQGPTEPPSQHIPKAFSRGQSGQGIKMVAILHPVPRLTISGAKPPLEHMLSWHTRVQL